MRKWRHRGDKCHEKSNALLVISKYLKDDDEPTLTEKEGIETSGVRSRDGCLVLCMLREQNNTFNHAFLFFFKPDWLRKKKKRMMDVPCRPETPHLRLRHAVWNLGTLFILNFSYFFPFIHQNSWADRSRKSRCCHHLQQKLRCVLSMDRLPNRNSR
jgi:hypothetical protein